jgi:hypothetical protein
MAMARAEIARLAAIINAPATQLPAFSSTGSPQTWLEIDDRGFHVMFDDSGRELVRTTYQTMDEMLYHVFQSVTFSMASDAELKNRVKGVDSRRQLFKLQEHLMERLSLAWAARKRAEHAQILERHPFNDALAKRSDRWGVLMHQGMSRAEAVAQAEREIPATATETRRQLVAALVEGMLSPAYVKEALSKFPWDSNQELVKLRAQDIAHMLEGYLGNHRKAQEIEDWANALEGRDDIGFEPGQATTLEAVLHELANPVLEGALTRKSAERMLAQLRAAGPTPAPHT